MRLRTGKMTRRRKAVYAVVGTFVLLVLIVYALLQSEWLVLRIVASAIDRLETSGARIEVGDISGSLLSGITLSEVEVGVARGEEPILSADMLSLRYSPILLATKRQLGTFSMYGPKLLLEKKNGTWNYSPLFAKDDSISPADKPEEGTVGGVLPFSLRHMSIQNGAIYLKAEQEVTVSKINIFASISSDTNRTQMMLHNGRFTVNDELQVVRLRGEAELKTSGVSLDDIQLKTEKSLVSLDGEIDTLGMHISLKDCSIDIEEFVDALQPELDLKGRVTVTGTYDQVAGARKAKGKMTISGTQYEGRDIGLLDFSLGVDDSKFDVMLNSWRLGEGSADGSVHLDLAGRKPSFSFDCNLDTFELGRFLGREIALTGNIKVNGMGTSLKDATARGEAKLGPSSVEGVRLDELVSAFSYTSGVVSLDDFDAKLGGGQILSSGTVSADHVELDTEIHEIQLSELGPVLGLKDLDGTLNSYMWMSGPLDNPSLSGTAWISKAKYKEMKFEHIGTNINVQDVVKEPRGFATLDLAGIEVGGPPLKRGSIEVTAQGDELIYEIWATAEEGSLDVKGQALLKDGALKGELDKLFLSYRGQVVENVGTIAASYSTSGVFLSPARVKILGTEMGLTGLTLSQDKASLGIAADSLSLKSLGKAIGSELDIDGFLTFDFRVSGTPEDPSMNLSLDLRDVIAGKASLDSATAEISYADQLIRIDQFFIYRNERRSTLSGHFPVNLSLGTEGTRIPESPVSLDANFNDVGAWIFLPLKDVVSVAEGRIDADLSLRGTPRNPLMTGTMEISSPKVIFRPTLTESRDVMAKLRLEGERLELVSITGRAGEGHVEVNGYVTFEGLVPEDYKVSVKAREASMRGFYRDVRDAVVNADILVTRGSEMLEVSGDVEVLQCLLTTEFRTSAVPMAAVKHEVSYDLTVHADRNVRLENKDAEIEMATDVTVNWKPGKMVLSGVMDILSGTFSYSGITQPFTVKKGEFTFSNAPELNPSLDVEAEANVRVTETDPKGNIVPANVVILLTVTGTMLEPSFNLSVPEPPPEFLEKGIDITGTDIITYLGLGYNPADVPDTEYRLLAQAGDVGFTMLQKRIVRALQRSIGLDEIKVQTEVFGSEKTAQLKVGKYIRPDLYLSYSHDLFAKVKDEYRAEYYIWRHSSIIGSIDNEGRYNLGMGFTIRY